MSHEEADRLTEEAAKRHGPQLFRIAKRMLRNWEDAEEVLYDALTRYNTALRKGTVIRTPLAFLKTVLRNRANDILRARKSRRLDAHHTLTMDVADSRARPEEEASENELRERREQAEAWLTKTKPNLADVYFAYYRDHLTFQQINERYGVPISTAHDQLAKACKLLADHFKV